MKFFAYFAYNDWGRVIGEIKQNEVDCRDTAPATHVNRKWAFSLLISLDATIICIAKCLHS